MELSIESFEERISTLEPTKKRWLIAIVFVFTLAVFIALLGKACEWSGDQERIEGEIRNSQTLQAIDQLCRDFPKPGSLSLERRALQGNSFTANVSQTYAGEASYDEIRTLARDWAIDNEWEIKSLEDTSQYLRIHLVKGRRSVSIGKFSGFVYSCSEITRD